jgi:hypothetical protein
MQLHRKKRTKYNVKGNNMKKVIIFTICVSLFISLMPSCSKESTFIVGEPIRVGTTTLTVSRAETVLFERKFVFAVFIKWQGLSKGPSEMDIIKGLFAKFTLTDSSGKKYPCWPIPEYRYRYEIMLQNPQSQTDWRSRNAMMAQMEYDRLKMPEDWVLIFDVPADSQRVTLHIKNPFFEKGQPRNFAVGFKK